MPQQIDPFYYSAAQHNIFQRLSFKIYDKIPKWQPYYPNHMFLSNIGRTMNTIAWHSQYQTVFPHTLNYRMTRAITKNDVKQVKKILDNRKFDVDQTIQNKYKMNALMYAALINRYNIMELLLLHGANINKQDQYGNTSLMKAVINDSLEAVNTLMKNGCDRNIKNNYGRTAVDKISHRLNGDHIIEFINKYPKTQRRFPKFKIQLDIEKMMRNPFWQYVGNYKIYDKKTKVFPFNDFKGCYRIDFTSYRTVQQLNS